MECVLGIVVAVLSILVTTLIGWQILTVVNINKKVRMSLNKGIETAKAAQKEELRKIRCEAIGTALYNIGEYQLSQKSYAMAFSSYIKALVELYDENPNSAEVEVCLDKLIDIVDTLRASGQSIMWPDYAKDRWLNAIMKIDDKRKLPIVKFLVECPVIA